MHLITLKHMGEFVNDTREFGYTQIELYSNLTLQQLSELLGIDDILISSVTVRVPSGLPRVAFGKLICR